MKILHLISSGGMYGAEAVILNLMRVLHSGSYESALGVFLHASEAAAPLYERAKAEALETYAVRCHGQIDRSVPMALRNLVEQSRADIVHAHGYKADVYLYTALRKLGIPLVSTCHTWYDNNVSLRLYGALDRYILRKYSGVVAVSEQVRLRLLRAGVPEDRVTLIRNGINLQPFGQLSNRPLDADRPLRVGLVARLEPEKGVDLFLRIAAKVLLELPLTQFIIVGDGPGRSKLQSLVDELGIGGSAHLLGRQEDMVSFYASLDLLVSSSRQEGLPIALLEGMASGLPVAAFAVGEVPDLVRNDETGLLVEANNVPALTQALLDLLRSPATRARMGAAARDLVTKEFSADRMAADYVKVYERALDAPVGQTLW